MFNLKKWQLEELRQRTTLSDSNNGIEIRKMETDNTSDTSNVFDFNFEIPMKAKRYGTAYEK